MKREQLIDALAEKFCLNCVPSEEFDGRTGGVWVRDDICKQETDWYNYADGTMEENDLNRFLRKAGWTAEPYDSETIMLYRT